MDDRSGGERAVVFAFGAFPVFLALTAHYLLSARRLVERVREHHPEHWRNELGAPRFVAHHRQRGLSFEVQLHLEPLGPFLRWLVLGSAGELGGETWRLHRSTRRRFLLCLVTFPLVCAGFLLLHLGIA